MTADTYQGSIILLFSEKAEALHGFYFVDIKDQETGDTRAVAYTGRCKQEQEAEYQWPDQQTVWMGPEGDLIADSIKSFRTGSFGENCDLLYYDEDCDSPIRPCSFGAPRAG